MASEDVTIKRRSGTVATLENEMCGIDNSAHEYTTAKQFHYKDEDGNTHQCANIDEKARFTDLAVTDSMTFPGGDSLSNYLHKANNDLDDIIDGSAYVKTTVTQRDGLQDILTNGLDGSVFSLPPEFDLPVTTRVPRVEKKNGVWTCVELGPDYEHPDGKTFYISTTGSDGNDGSSGSPFRSVDKARLQPGVRKIIVEGGVYQRAYTLKNPPVADLSIICPTGDAVFASWENLSWSKTGGYTNVYEAARSSVYDVRDSSVPDAYSLYTQYTKVASVAAVDAQPGSWYTDDVTVYVHRLASAVVDNDIKCLMSIKTGVSENVSVYFEGITFAGGSKVVQLVGDTDKRVRIGMKNCKVYYSDDDNVELLGNVEYNIENCEYAGARLDGLNTHSYLGYDVTGTETNCLGYANGWPGESETQNGSSLHDNCRGIRIGCEYYGNLGPNCPDVNNAKSYNFDCYAHDSAAVSNNADWYTDSAMWLDSCRGTNFDDDSGAGTFYTYNTTVAGSTPFERNESPVFIGRKELHPLDVSTSKVDITEQGNFTIPIGSASGSYNIDIANILRDSDGASLQTLAYRAELSLRESGDEGYIGSSHAGLLWYDSIVGDSVDTEMYRSSAGNFDSILKPEIVTPGSDGSMRMRISWDTTTRTADVVVNYAIEIRGMVDSLMEVP